MRKGSEPEKSSLFNAIVHGLLKSGRWMVGVLVLGGIYPMVTCLYGAG